MLVEMHLYQTPVAGFMMISTSTIMDQFLGVLDVLVGLQPVNNWAGLARVNRIFLCRVLSTAFHVWWDHVRYQHAEMICMMSARRRAWRAWRLVYMEDVRSRNELAHSQYGRWKLLLAWQGFVIHVQHAATKRARLREAFVHYCQSSTYRAWAAWRVCPCLPVATMLLRSGPNALLYPAPES